MSHVPHELPEQFPDSIAKIHDLRMSDQHFAKLADSYHDLNRAVHRAETNVEPTDDFHMQELRKQRLRLLDQISAYLV